MTYSQWFHARERYFEVVSSLILPITNHVTAFVAKHTMYPRGTELKSTTRELDTMALPGRRRKLPMSIGTMSE